MSIKRKIKIKVNENFFEAIEGIELIKFLKKIGLEIPTLCTHPDFEKSNAYCRMCLVKVRLDEKEPFKFVPSCSVKTADKMEIITDDAEIARIRHTLLEMLFMEHAGLCSTCFRNQDCELQSLAIKYGIDEFRFVPKVAEMKSEEALERLRDNLSRRVIDRENPSIARESTKCIECRRCVRACDEIQTVKALGTQKRGINMGIGTENYTPLECTLCGQCALHCPTGAIIEKNDLVEVVRAIKDPKKIVIAQVAPSVRVTLGEEFGLLPGTVVTGKMVAAIRKCGFDKVFDVVTGADFTIVEEGSEFLEIVKNKGKRCSLPLFTSCCPAWVLFAEQNYPEILPHLSSAKSPQLMLASLVRNYYAKKSGINPKDIVLVSIMPCTAKKYEISREEFSSNGQRDIDFVLTVRELAHLIKNFRIPFNDLPDSEFDPALGISSGSGLIFATSGGVTEAAIRTAHFYLTGESFPKLEFAEVRGIKWIKEAQVNLAGKDIKIAVAHGLENARKIVEKALKEKCPYDFVEIMACPGGCIGGGGQPIPTDNEIRKARIKAVYDTDKTMAIRESHRNPVVEKVYRDFLYKPLGRKAEKLLHTKHYPYKFKFKDK